MIRHPWLFLFVEVALLWAACVFLHFKIAPAIIAGLRRRPVPLFVRIGAALFFLTAFVVVAGYVFWAFQFFSAIPSFLKQ